MRWVTIIIGIARRTAAVGTTTTTTTRTGRRRPTATFLSTELMNLKLHRGKRSRGGWQLQMQAAAAR
jgi:subtilisin-like proprotein convertase family protein